MHLGSYYTSLDSVPIDCLRHIMSSVVHQRAQLPLDGLDAEF